MPNSTASEPHTSVTLNAFIIATIQRLKAAGIGDAELSTRLLVAHGLKLDRVQLISQSERLLTAKELRVLNVFIECRAQHEPVTRILGNREFWSLNFGLNEATLDPRPDSETLIEATLKQFPDHAQCLRILDLGTGTGCLLLSLLHELPASTGMGVDIAPRAVEQAEENAKNLGLDSRAKFAVDNWLNNITEEFDVIISNPPYIPAGDIPGLMPEVRDHDPMRALDGGADGLEAYRHIIPQLPRRLKKGGFSVFEVGISQAQAVADIFVKTGFSGIETARDLGGVERCVIARFAKTPSVP